MPVIKSKVIRVRDADGIWHDLPATVSEESMRAAERAETAAERAEAAAEYNSHLPVTEAMEAAQRAAESAEIAQAAASEALETAENAVEIAEGAEDTANRAAETATEAAVAATPAIVTGWLGENITPADPPVVIDTSLSVTGAAADAKAAGDAVAILKSALNSHERLVSDKELQTVTWSQGSISSVNGSAIPGNDKRIYTSFKGTCDFLLLSMSLGMKAAVFAYKNTRETADYLGVIINISAPDENGNLIVPITKGMTYAVSAGYVNESDILPSAGRNISIYKCFASKVEDNELSGNLSDETIIIGRSYSWVQGTINTIGNNYNSDYVIRTQNHIPATPGRIIRFTGSSTSTTASYVYFYDENKTFLYRMSLTEGDVTIPQRTAFVRFTYGNTSASGITVEDGMEYVEAFSLKVFNDTFTGYLNRIGFVEFTVTKGYWRNNGHLDTNSTAICVGHLLELPIGKTVRVVISEPGWLYSVKQSDATSGLAFTERLVAYSEFDVKKKYIAVMFYKKDETGEMIDLSVEDFHNSVMLFVSDYSVSKETFIHDVPENIGVLNTINRAYQMANLSYVPVVNLPTQVNTATYPNYIPEGTNIDGVMYSSVRDEGLYVPQCVSLQTYMTALLNPNSYIYTKTEPSPHYNGLTYYGAVCSSMVGWCYGIDDVIATTISFGTYPGMEIIEDQSPYGLKLGDMLNRPGVHIEIVTDIVKNNRGIIQYIELTDQVNNSSHPMTRKRQVSASVVQDMIDTQHYIAMRYHYIYKVPYTPSPWVNLDDETSEPEYNHNLSPRRGENANWRPGETIQIDVTDGTGFTSAKLYKGDTLVSTINIPAANLLEYSSLAYGSYKVCLTDGSNDSEFVYFDIIDTRETFTALGSKQVKAEYNSENGTPSSISFCEANSSDSDYKGVLAFHVLTDTEVSAGTATVEAPNTGAWLIKVMYKTAFGLYSGDLTSVNVT